MNARCPNAARKRLPLASFWIDVITSYSIHYTKLYDTYDGAEYIELYNTAATPVDIGGYVLAGPEYGQLCGGEDRWQFPVGTMIGANDYIVVAKDAHDGDDGFFEEFGIEADFELFDPSFFADNDYLFVANRITSYNVCYTKLLRFMISLPADAEE